MFKFASSTGYTNNGVNYLKRYKKEPFPYVHDSETAAYNRERLFNYGVLFLLIQKNINEAILILGLLEEQ